MAVVAAVAAELLTLAHTPEREGRMGEGGKMDTREREGDTLSHLEREEDGVKTEIERE